MKKNRVSILLSLGVLALLILVNGCAGSPSNYVGMVNNRPITQEEYMIARRNQFESYVLNTGLTPDDAAREQISDRAFHNLVEGIIFQDQLREHNITVSHREVIDTLTTNIPDLILNSRQFNEDGRFDQQKYRDSLLNNDPIDLSWLVRYYTDIYVPMEKLKSRVLDRYEVVESELRTEYIAWNSSASASVIHIDPAKFRDVIIHDREVRDYYRDNRTQYLTEPYTRLQYIIFPLKPSRTDSLRTRTVIDSVYAELEEGTPFAILAGTVSDSETSINRGEMPFLELNTFPSRIRGQLDQLTIDQYTRPFAVQDGWVIYQLMARTRNMVKLREIFISHKASRRTRDLLYDRIVHIRELANEIGLSQTAYEYDLDLITSDIITPDDPFLPELGKSDRIIQRGVNAEPGTIFEPVFHQLLEAYVLIEVMESQRLDFKPLADVYDDIRDKLLRERKHQLAQQRAEHYFRRVAYSRIIEEAEREGFAIYHFDRFDVNTYFPEVDPILLARAMFAAGKSRHVANPVITDNGAFVGVVHNLYPADIRQMTPFIRNDLRDRVIAERGDELFNLWLEEKISSARVRDWRHRVR